MRRIAPIATASALTCACVVVAGCGTAAGVRREGPAPDVTPRTQNVAAPAIASDPAALAGMVRRDGSVSPGVRRDLTPCAGDGYPVDTDAGDLTAGDGPDLVVNVTTCGDGIGIAAYVYRMIGGKYRCVFADERAPVYGTVADGRLRVVHEVYRSDDPEAYPAGEDSMTYAWRGDHFLMTGHAFTDFGVPAPTASPEPTSDRPVPLPKSSLLAPTRPSASAAPGGR